MEKKRCDWCLGSDLYMNYHDNEWGVPVHDDKVHFEFLVLESAQAGLSWITILKRREHYRRLYDDFNVEKVARYENRRIDMMLQDPGIIRNRKKIEASVNNAQCFLEIVEKYGSFDNYTWNFTDGEVIVNHWRSLDEVPANTSLSNRITKDMKQHGFRFLGTTILYAHLQSIGVVN
ncbi:MAG: DNA-3-methyladenine glycosylase I, partial [Bacteroidales bacterium]